MIHFRRYEPTDREAVAELHRETEAAAGRRLDLPELGSHPVLVAEVGERGGWPVAAFYIESTPEFCMVGRDAAVTAAMIQRAPEVLSKLKQCGFRIVRLLVPKGIVETERATIREALEAVGFKEIDSQFESYEIDLRPGGING